MDYDSTMRRRLRALRRIARSSLDPSSYPTARVVPAYWWDGHANFGDALTPWLLRPSGVIPVLVPPQRARLVGVGSILEHLHHDFDGVVWGTGLMHDRPRSLPNATFLAVRGRLTQERLGLVGDVAFGDGGILVSRVSQRPATRWELGFVPHADHLGSPVVQALRALPARQVQVIDVRRSPDRVVRDIASCSAVISTSLHGLIVADSFGIPAAWASLAPSLMGGTFKFHDYESGMTPGESRRVRLAPHLKPPELVSLARSAHPDRVAESIERLTAAIDDFPTEADLPFLALRRR